MDLIKLLEVIQVQRHDFLNHLQVISGLSQLNKYDRVREYINQVSAEMAQLSKTTRVKIPEVTAALLGGYNEAVMHQVEFDITVNSSMDCCRVPGQVVGESLEQGLHFAMEAMASPEIVVRQLEVVFAESEKQYTCRLLFPEPPLAELERLEKRLNLMGDWLNQHDGRVNMAVANSGLEIFLIFPREEVI